MVKSKIMLVILTIISFQWDSLGSFLIENLGFDKVSRSDSLNFVGSTQNDIGHSKGVLKDVLTLFHTYSNL